MKKVLICFLMSFVLLGIVVADEPDWISSPQFYARKYYADALEDGYFFEFGISPECVKLKCVARRLAEEDFQSLVMDSVAYTIYNTFFIEQDTSVTVTEDFDWVLDIALVDKTFFFSAYSYIDIIINLAKNSIFYDFEFFDYYDEEQSVKWGIEYSGSMGCTSFAFGAFSLKNTLSLLQKAAEAKYEYIYGEPVPDVVKYQVHLALNSMEFRFKR